MWEQRFKEAVDSGFKRNEYSRDRARIIHSASFRRLQGKTQVLGLGESDFYRTRLTHSLEVAQIGSGIAEFLKTKYPQSESPEIFELIPEQNLIESIGLAHDIGHPPFGHGGEVALNYSMRNDAGFEGNAQTLRICTKLGEYSEEEGLNLTRRTLLGLVKYPAFHNDVVNKNLYAATSGINLDAFKPPKCVYDCDKEQIDWILRPFTNDRTHFMSSEPKQGKHAKPQFKSFDSSIMELADDIAYGVHDLEDAIALRLVDESIWRREVVDKLTDQLNTYPLADDIESLTRLLFSGENKTRKRAVSQLVNYFITNAEVVSLNEFTHKLLDYQSKLLSKAREELDILQEFVRNNVILTPEVQTLEYKGQQMIVQLFDVISNNPKRLLPKKYYQMYVEQNNNLRVISDYIAGTTDDYATRLYHKIFTPSSGSIFDRL
ncbi:deoxyguanosinetriphosphate triphosphohydrolase family protein [Vibrio parahaemolyticus]|nr:deoxyguanosinetriphosphate triphosphohydrolase family protein [Vibrio parahaemolyticus]EJS9608628.1 deoxyguanosinetriphosphate triphosphohydrolase family protein [Vibrio parahaemolyticus]ELB2184151.1 deoxyguanosinetriphosphate triphosphohydrolase family protein [Vibrio parahaemolyticus]